MYTYIIYMYNIYVCRYRYKNITQTTLLDKRVNFFKF